MSEYAFHPEAFADLDEIWEFIAKDNIDSADRVIAEIFEAIRNLLPFPQRGHRRPDLTARPLRFIRVYEFLIAYATEESPRVRVLPGVLRYVTLSQRLAGFAWFTFQIDSPTILN